MKPVTVEQQTFIATVIRHISLVISPMWSRAHLLQSHQKLHLSCPERSLQYFMNLLRVLACISWLFLLYIKLALFNILVVPSLQLSVNMFDLLYHNTRRETFVKLKIILEKKFQ